jgi:hypothetical protein
VVGGTPRAPFSAALGLAAALGFPQRVGVIGCVVVGGDPRAPFSAALNLVAALGLVFFGVRASWIVDAGGTPVPPLLRGARPGRCAQLGLLRRGCLLDCCSRGKRRNPPPPFSAALGLAAALS